MNTHMNHMCRTFKKKKKSSGLYDSILSWTIEREKQTFFVNSAKGRLRSMDF